VSARRTELEPDTGDRPRVIGLASNGSTTRSRDRRFAEFRQRYPGWVKFIDDAERDENAALLTVHELGALNDLDKC
jgi:hypothetical protein